jgi:hypothetical protein
MWFQGTRNDNCNLQNQVLAHLWYIPHIETCVTTLDESSIAVDPTRQALVWGYYCIMYLPVLPSYRAWTRLSTKVLITYHTIIDYFYNQLIT